MSYENLDLKQPQQSSDYDACSSFIVSSIEGIMKNAIDQDRNKIIINTNLKLGIPMENVNKIAGPFIEAWALEVFAETLEDKNNEYSLINVEGGERLNMADVKLWNKEICNL